MRDESITWVPSSTERTFTSYINHENSADGRMSKKVVTHTAMESYIPTLNSLVKNALDLSDFEKAMPFSVSMYDNGICEGIDKVTCSLPLDYVDMNSNFKAYTGGLVSLRQRGRFLIMEIQGEYIDPLCNLKEHILRVINYLAFTARIFKQPVKRVQYTEVFYRDDDLSGEGPWSIYEDNPRERFGEKEVTFSYDMNMSRQEFIELVYQHLHLSCIEFYTDSTDAWRLYKADHPGYIRTAEGTIYSIDLKRDRKTARIYSRSVLSIYDKKRQLSEVKNINIPEDSLIRFEVRVHDRQFALLKDKRILDNNYYQLVDIMAGSVCNRLIRYSRGEAFSLFSEIVEKLPPSAYALKKFLPASVPQRINA